MLAELLWRCPKCGASWSLRPRLSEGWRCRACRTLWTRSGGGRLTAQTGEESETRPAWGWYDIVRSTLRLPDAEERGQAGERWWRESGPAVLCLGLDRRSLRGPLDIRGAVDRRRRVGKGKLSLTERGLCFRSHRGWEKTLDLERLTAVTTTSHALEVKGRGEPVWLVTFRWESCREWEETVRLALQRWYGRRSLRILEFQPHLRTTHET